MKKEKYVDSFLANKLTKYDGWLDKGQISFSSKVIPVGESFNAKQWVMPTEQVMESLRGAKSIALKNCECRTHYKRCENPLEVCMILNEVGDQRVKMGKARHISLVDAVSVLKNANEKGLVHLSLHMPNHEVFALCSCCSCCCHDLQLVQQHERKDLMVRSEYIAITNFDDCTHCGDCADRCVFSARSIKDEQMEYNSNDCLGCGLCVTSCPAGAISMELRESDPKS